MEWTSKKVRETFIEYFSKKKDHTFVPSNSVIPHHDPTLLFTNAGMNQFKPIFLGEEDNDTSMGKLKRACNSQKCIRAGGKHNDLDDVGQDTYHHTFFEMLGNWSFGDYFKKEAISWAWELLTEVYGLEKDRIYASYFGGNEEEGIPEDTEAKDYWRQFLPESRVLPFGKKENFWEMGDTGPCGACSEIHYDRIGGRDASKIVNEDDPNVLEIWNLVFIEYNRKSDGKLEKLPKRHVDTGMGFERLTSILQNKPSNYDTDVFTPIFSEIKKFSKCRDYTGKLGKEDKDGIDTAYRVIGDHVRTLTVALTDGGRIGDNKRDYVLKRICRRACRFSREFMKTKVGFLSDMVDIVVQTLGPFFPELKINPESVKKLILEEEVNFEKSLNNGIKKFKEFLKKSKNKIFSGYDAFLMVNSYGFQIEDVRLMAEEKNHKVDLESFMKEMENHKEKSKREKKSKGIEIPKILLDVSVTSKLKDQKIPFTNDQDKYKWDGKTQSEILSLITPAKMEQLKCFEENGEIIGIIVDQTSFYYEQGGQTFDTGIMKNENCEIEILNVQCYAGYILHIGKLKNGSIEIGDSLTCLVNYSRRKLVASNHTCTHLLNFSLRKLFGRNKDVEQQGSDVNEKRLRFDFNWKGKGLNDKQIESLEKDVGTCIKNNYEVFDRSMPYEKALEFYGIRHMFDETYPEIVRVVGIGPKSIEEISKDPKNKNLFEIMSLELCGGTHLKQTGDSEGFLIYKETSSSSGVRRIFGITGNKYEESFNKGKEFEKRLKELELEEDQSLFIELKKGLVNDIQDYLFLSIPVRVRLENGIKKLFVERQKKKEKIKEESQMKRILEIIEESYKKVRGGDKFLVLLFDFLEVKTMNCLMDFSRKLEKKLGKGNMIPLSLFGVNKDIGEISFITTVPKELTKKMSSKECLKTFEQCIGARGGGKPVKVQGKGKKMDGIQEALESSKNYFFSKFQEIIE